MALEFALFLSAIALLAASAALVIARRNTRLLHELRETTLQLEELAETQQLTHTAVRYMTGYVAELRMPTFGPYSTFMTPYPQPGYRTPGYLPLLHLSDARQPMKSAYNLQFQHRGVRLAEGVCGLLGQRYWEPLALSWEPHLVAAVALVLNINTSEAQAPEHVKLLWERIDENSWVTPQLLVAASMVDPDFEQNAMDRIDAATKPKTLNAILALLGDESVAAKARRDEAIRAAIDSDLDDGDKLALRWRTRIQELAAELREARGR